MPDRKSNGPLMGATNIRLSPAQHRALELIAEKRGLPLSTAARELLDERMRDYTDPSGVDLVEAIEADMAAEAITSKRLAHYLGDRDAPAATQNT